MHACQCESVRACVYACICVFMRVRIKDTVNVTVFLCVRICAKQHIQEQHMQRAGIGVKVSRLSTGCVSEGPGTARQLDSSAKASRSLASLLVHHS